jgi:site-specific recombinase XerD
MIKRVRSKHHGTEKKPRTKANRKTFTDLGIRRLRPPKEGQELYWDKGQRGLSLMVSSGGTKTFRCQFKLNGEWKTYKIGRFGEVVTDETENANVAWAHERVRKDRALALKGIDPREHARPEQPSTETYGAVVDQFIELYAKRRQRTWKHTERTLKGSRVEREQVQGIARWLKLPIVSITSRDAYSLLDGMIAEGHGPKAQLTLAWIKTLWKWAYKRDIVADPIMEKVDLDVGGQTGKKVFDDDVIRATWRAADRLDPVEAAYVKLLILLAPRKAALAGMRRSHLDDADDPALWTTPPELVKQSTRAESKRALRGEEPRVYHTPLPALAARIIRSVPRRGDDPDLVFPSRTRGVRPISPTGPLTKKLVEAGAPADFEYHAWRHTIATWFQDQGHDKFDRGLILNHAESGVTARYSHGYALDRKRELLDKWARHVEGLVSPPGAARLA